MITYKSTIFGNIGVAVHTAAFCGRGSVDEWHVMMHVEARKDSFHNQLERLSQAERLLLSEPEWSGAKCVCRRYFLSDSTNQQPEMREPVSGACSVIQQPPLDGSRVSLWLYLARGVEVEQEHGCTVCSHEGYTHLWKMGLQSTQADSAMQTREVLDVYEELLHKFGANVADNCIRTWFFVRDVDTHYAGLVKARREWFTLHGLTEHTHYIASTGIGGGPADTRAVVQLGAYALKGCDPGQIRYLCAPEWLNATHEYGVTFERGTAVEYADRAHIFISGTASIDHQGQVLHVGDIVRQTQRMWANVEALLRNGNASLNDVVHIIVYLRDVADYEIVHHLFQERFPEVPTVITLAPVCRPAWLIEMECMAIVPRETSLYRPF